MPMHAFFDREQKHKVAEMLHPKKVQTFQVFISIFLFSILRDIVCEDYYWPLPNGFPVGSRAVIRGVPVNNFDKGFIIDLLTFTPFDNDGDIDFHFSVRFGHEVIVFNNFIKGEGWQQETHISDSRFQAGQPFEISILSEPSKFGVYINDSHYFDYAHRKPIERIKYLKIYGTVSVSLITVDMVSVYSWPLKHGLPPNQKITITGTPAWANFDQEFSINFQNCQFYGKDCSIAFRMLVRYGKKVIVNNSYEKGIGWGYPQVHSNLPIKIGQSFNISITKESSQFRVYVNEQHICTFRLRPPYSDFTHLALKGLVNITTIKLSRNNFLLTEYKKVVNLSQMKNKDSKKWIENFN